MRMELPSPENSATGVLHQADDPIQPDAAVRRELEYLLASRALRDSDHLKRFLRYVVEKTLAGEADQLKEYRLGVEVFGRDPSFDPKIDPVVRMAARRLRAKLQQHYENGGRGSGNGIRIEVPKGGYAACFVTAPAPQVAEGEHLAAEELAEKVDRRYPVRAGTVPAIGNRTLATAVVFVIATLIAGGFYYRSHQARRLTDQDTVVLADFSNSTGDPVFDDTLKTALAISLEQSPFLNVLSDRKVAATLQTMTRPAGMRLTADVTRELCQRAGSKAYIAGAIGSLGSEYVLGLKAVNCQNNTTLAGNGRLQGESAGRAGRGCVQDARRTGRVAGNGAKV
jgi:hypothetical protein